MRTARLGSPRPAVKTKHAIILFRVGPYRLGIDAGALKEIRNDDGLTAEELGCQSILSAHAFLGIAGGEAKRLLVLRPGRVALRVALRVDRVERMIETHALCPLPRAFKGAEREWYCGFAFDAEEIFPVLNPEALRRHAQPAIPEVLASRFGRQDIYQEAASR
jgi:chemotaxis signal transduction protein